MLSTIVHRLCQHRRANNIVFRIQFAQTKWRSESTAVSRSHENFIIHLLRSVYNPGV